MRGKHDRYGHAVAQRRIIPAHAGQTALSSSSLVNATDHPRACGANGGLPMAFSWLTGSSPRMRGKRVEPVCDGAEVRIIPAHAGQTAPNRQDACPCPDHPRACGANRRYGRFSTRPVGSSPRMRGKRPVHHRVHADLRIIPAHAGQTPCSPRAARRWTDHPRACGANVFLAVDMPAEAGSSPRMRGKPGGWVERRHSRRIIPAHAGQTLAYYKPLQLPSDHPRACGANSALRPSNILQSGSSPRMRGKQRLTSIEHFAERIIPAHAGQTAVPTVADGTRSDHPRACGANHDCVRPLFRPFGSSPRMRGKHAVAGAARRVVRIIPAHAGQTSGLTYPMPSVADHPRACGANFRVREVVDAYAGSSPRMRGKRLHKRHRGKPVRIIPAHAGQT